jgi:hypothetical protein
MPSATQIGSGCKVFASALTQGAPKITREIARELKEVGYANKRGTPYSASCVKSMVEGR